MAIKLRDYQEQTIKAIIDYFATFKDDINKNPLAVLPTGSGKSIIAAAICEHFLNQPDFNIMLLTHSSELVKQNSDKIKELNPNLNVGVYAAKLKSKQTQSRVICGTVQSVYKKLLADPQSFGPRQLLIIDEAHLLSSKDKSMYRQAINALRTVAPHMRVLGMSATPYRLDCGMLTEQENAIFSDVCIDLNPLIPNFIEQGYLSPLVSLDTPVSYDFSNAKITAGDFNQAQAENILSNQVLLNKACDVMALKAKDRKAWLVFCSGVLLSDTVVKLLNKRGISAKTVHSKLSTQENNQAIQEYRAGAIQCLVSANQLTTGFDVPKTDFIGMLRPTMSPSLHVQMLGRGMRVAPGKQDCLVLDFVRNIQRLGPVNNVKVPFKNEAPKEQDINKLAFAGSKDLASSLLKRCGRCLCTYDFNAPCCPVCQFDEFSLLNKDLSEYKPLDLDITDLASSKPIDFNAQAANNKLACVLNLIAQPHRANSGRNCIKLIFSCQKPNDFKIFDACYYLNFDLEGKPAQWAANMWKALGGLSPTPQCTAEACGRTYELKRPKYIEVLRRNKTTRPFDEIRQVIF